ncbi:unnamed protein product [Allacma fusca]|uniref:Uncharacterized protein n=1 Tax=Allacma fusca TaxID=39272 RepID=A0A8J2K9T0_9HEXA|nr:unnamed protein product [Allacma fusca]
MWSSSYPPKFDGGKRNFEEKKGKVLGKKLGRKVVFSEDMRKVMNNLEGCRRDLAWRENDLVDSCGDGGIPQIAIGWNYRYDFWVHEGRGQLWLRSGKSAKEVRLVSHWKLVNE